MPFNSSLLAARSTTRWLTWITPLRSIVCISLVGFLMSGCASIQETVAQRLAWERWEKCKHIPEVSIQEVRPDGQIWVWAPPGSFRLRESQACLTKAAAEQGQRGTVVPDAAVATVSPPVQAHTQPAIGTRGITAPAWTRGDEWAYRYEQPSGTGTFVWSVDRMENVNGVDHYVIKSGTREIFYRVADGALTLQKVSGEVVNRYVPAWETVSWPLSVGRPSEARFTDERPAARQTEDVVRSCKAEAEETVTVPAGTFRVIVILCTNQRTGAMVNRIWYSPEVKHMVKEISQLSNGTRLRELIAFKLK